MNVHNSEIIKKVKQWMSYGNEDLNLARHGLTLAEKAPFRLIAYHAKQCAEKYIKAYLVFHEIDFPFTHNISHLLELWPGTGWDDKLLDAEELTTFAVSTRYPGEEEPVTESEAKHAIEIAGIVREIIQSALIKKDISL